MAHVAQYDGKIKWEWKINTAGTYAEIINVTDETLPGAEAIIEDITDTQDTCLVEENQMPNQGDVQLTVLYLDDDTVHMAIAAVAGERTGNANYLKATLPSGVTEEYIGNIKSFKPQGINRKQRQKRVLIMHVNAEPTVAAAP